jgi:hypothetical protein
MKTLVLLISAAVLFTTLAKCQQPTESTPAAPAYTPKYAGDRAHSNAEAAALGYMRTVVSAQKVYKKKHDKYATTLAALVGSGSFTRRMVDTKRGDYTVSFRAKGEGYSLALTPNQYDPEHRAFYVDESGVFRASDSAPATGSSPEL